MEDFATGSVYINTIDINYYTAGDPTAPPVVLLHGGGIDSAKIAWRHLMEPLGQTHRVYAMDFPGYGESDPPPDGTPYTTAYLIRALTAFVNTLGLERFSLVGLSMGGATALGFSLAHPQRVEQLALVGSYGIQDNAPFHIWSRMALQAPPLAQRTAWWFTRAFRPVLWTGLSMIYFNRFALNEEVINDAEESVRLEIFYEWLRSEITPEGCLTNYTPRLPDLDIPTLLVHGQFDPSVPVKWPRRAARLIPNADLKVLPLCGHWVNREQPQRFNRIVVQFLRQHTT